MEERSLTDILEKIAFELENLPGTDIIEARLEQIGYAIVGLAAAIDKLAEHIPMMPYEDISSIAQALALDEDKAIRA